MIEIVALVFLGRQIGQMARAKGLSSGRWIFRLVIFWISLECLGMIIASRYFNIPLDDNISQLPAEDLVNLSLFGIMFAVGGYLLTRYMLEQVPAAGDRDEDIDQIGR